MSEGKVVTLSIVELLAWFADEGKAVAWLERAVWGARPVCPHCGGVENIRPFGASKRFAYWHADCRSAFTVKTGGAMHASKVSCRKWAVAMYYVLTARKGVSSLQLSKELGVTQKTAWFMLARLREGCRRGEYKLAGEVEVDEAYFGGKEGNKHARRRAHAGHGVVGKAAVVGMRERGGPVIAAAVSDTTRPTMEREIGRAVAAGAVVYTDEHRSYRGLRAMYRHRTVKHSAGQFVDGGAHTNGIESVWAVLKRAIYGTYHHVSAKHLPRYVNEAAFRLNEGNVRVDTAERMVALARGMMGRRLTYAALTAAVAT